jgi:hypothetical protein
VKPIWISETNVIPYDDTARQYPAGGFRATLDEQASYMVQSLAIGLAIGVQRLEVNRMIDGTDFQAGGEPFGLVRNDGTVRPAYYAYRTAVILFSGTTSGQIAHDSNTGVYLVTLHRPGATVMVMWDKHPRAIKFGLQAASKTLLYDKFGQRLNVAAHNGNVIVKLPGATGNTNTASRTDYVIGGNPVIAVEST